MPHTCATAPEVVFETLDELKAHYHTDWHRYNLKRKVAGLPMLTQRMFERVVNQTVALAAAAEEAELKKGARRQGRQGGRGANDVEDESGDESDSGSDWEEVSGDEAAEVLQKMEERRTKRQQQQQKAAEEEEEDDDAEMADDSDGEPGPDVSLASNGFELVVGDKVLGSRDLARYYKQKHRPESSSTAVVCARAANHERQLGIVQNGSQLPAYHKKVTDDEARIQKSAQNRNAKKLLALGISSSGPQFRGFRDA